MMCVCACCFIPRIVDRQLESTGPRGPDDYYTLATECNLIIALLRLGECAEAEAAGRETLKKHRRIFGRDHCDARFKKNSRQGKHAEAVEIEREVLVSTTSLIGGEHEHTLISAFNLRRSRGAVKPRKPGRSSGACWLWVGARPGRLTGLRNTCFKNCARLVSQRDGQDGI